MGIIKRKETYQLRIMIKGVEFRRSLKTKNKKVAQEIYNQWLYQYQLNKINRTNEIPLIHIPKKDSNNKAHQIEITNISIERAFNQHIRVNQANFVS